MKIKTKSDITSYFFIFECDKYSGHCYLNIKISGAHSRAWAEERVKIYTLRYDLNRMLLLTAKQFSNHLEFRKVNKLPKLRGVKLKYLKGGLKCR